MNAVHNAPLSFDELSFEEVEQAEAPDWDAAVAGLITGLVWAGIVVGFAT